MIAAAAAAAEDDMVEHVPRSVLSGIKEKLLVTDLINQMEITDGLKEVLISLLSSIYI